MLIFSYALMPVFVLILLGFSLKKLNFVDDDVWAGVEKLTYYVFFPALLIRSIGRQSVTGMPWQEMLLIIAGVLVSATLVLAVIYRYYYRQRPAAFTSVFQGGVRFNTFIALAICYALYGEQGLAYASLAAGFLIVIINLLCIGCFVALAEQPSGRFGRKALQSTAMNPLIIGCTLGWLVSLSEVGLHPLVADILEIIARAALPLGLLAVGAALKLRKISSHVRGIAIASTVQFLLKPVIAWLLITATGLSGVVAAVILIAFISPTAPSAYILARQLGGDTDKMASIITVQTLLAFLVMPLLAGLLING